MLKGNNDDHHVCLVTVACDIFTYSFLVVVAMTEMMLMRVLLTI